MRRNSLTDEKGTALVIALLLLVLLTVIGISAIGMTVYETSLSGNERVAADAFYAAEAGVQIGLDQLPDKSPIAVAQVGEGSRCWSGSPKDKGSPKSLTSHGAHQRSGYDASWEFKRYQVNATGESSAVMKEVEVQASYGPFAAGTQYNN